MPKRGTFVGRVTFALPKSGLVSGFSLDEMKHMSLANQKVKCEHSTRFNGKTIGRVKRSWVGDDNWMWMRARLKVDKPHGAEAWNDVKSGKLRGISIGFVAGVDDTDSSKCTYKTVREVSLVKEPAEHGATIVYNHSNAAEEIHFVSAAIEFFDTNYNRFPSVRNNMDQQQQQQQQPPPPQQAASGSASPAQPPKSLAETITFDGSSMHHLARMRQQWAQLGKDPAEITPEDVEKSAVNEAMELITSEADPQKRQQKIAELMKAYGERSSRPLQERLKKAEQALQTYDRELERATVSSAQSQTEECRSVFNMLIDGDKSDRFNNVKTKDLLVAVYADPAMAPLRDMIKKLSTDLSAFKKQANDYAKEQEERKRAEREQKGKRVLDSLTQPDTKRPAADFGAGNHPMSNPFGSRETTVEHSAAAMAAAAAAAAANPVHQQWERQVSKLPENERSDDIQNSLAAMFAMRERMEM